MGFRVASISRTKLHGWRQPRRWWHFRDFPSQCALSRAGILPYNSPMSNDEFTKLFKYMTERFDRVDQALEGKASKEDMQRVFGLLDAVAKSQEISDDERLVMGHQLERLDRGTHELARKIGYELSA